VNDHSDSVDRYLLALFARARPSTLVEVRWRTPTGMAQRFAAVADLANTARHIVELGERTDVYVGVLPRWRPQGGRAAVASDGRIVWVDLDSADSAGRLRAFSPVPHLMVASGGPEHLHAYWTLRRAIAPAQIERVNRRLAFALGGDLSSTDAARILRPPQTLNHGRGRAPVKLVLLRERSPVGLRALISDLPGPPVELVPRATGRARRSAGGDALLRIDPQDYVRVLTGQQVGRDRKVRCPLHDDSTPSLHVYRDPGRGWFCFGCERGGSIYDLAAALWGIEPRGSGFAALREGLRSALGQDA